MKSTALALAAACWLFVAVEAARAQSFIINPSPTAGALPDVIYNPGGIGAAPPPSIYLTGILPPLVVDAISYSRPVSDLGFAHTFSVSPTSAGALATDVATQSPFFEQGADVYFSTGGGAHTMLFDGDGLVGLTGLTAAPLGIFEVAPSDNLNALDMRSASLSGSIYFSVDPTTAGAYGGPPVGTAASVYIAAAVAGYDTSVPSVYAASSLLGLATSDDIDALIVFEDGTPGFGAGDTVRFSLATGSPSLVGLGASPADIIDVTGPGGVPTIVATAAGLGLLATDDIDALDVLVPEPGTLVLFGLGGLLAAVWAWRKRKPIAVGG